MVIEFEKEVLAFLNLPSIPKKEWNCQDAFKNGVAVVSLRSGGEAYAVASFDPEKDAKPNIKKVFGMEQFLDVVRVYLVPDYMETDLENADLDEESKKKAEEIVNEAKEIENEGTELEAPEKPNDNPYLFDFIHNDEEALAYIEAYNKKNKISGKLPKKHETILMRLEVLYAEANKTDENESK